MTHSPNHQDELNEILYKYAEDLTDVQHIKLRDVILALLSSVETQSRIDEVQVIEAMMENDERPNADWYREPFECVHDLVERRITELKAQAGQEGGEQNEA